jgi:hypothetical protein
MSGKLAYTIDEAAEAVSVSVATIRRAIKATDPKAFPPPLKAKRLAAKSSEKESGAYRIPHAELTAWVESLQDA